MVGAFAWRGRDIGTVRMVPIDSGVAPCATVLERHRVDVPKDSGEVGRLIIAPQYRGGPDLFRQCLFRATLHMVRTRNIAHLYATCTALPARLYRRFGYHVVIRDAMTHNGEAYSLVSGAVPQILRALAASDRDRLEAELALAGEEGLAVWEDGYGFASKPVRAFS